MIEYSTNSFLGTYKVKGSISNVDLQLINSSPVTLINAVIGKTIIVDSIVLTLAAVDIGSLQNLAFGSLFAMNESLIFNSNILYGSRFYLDITALLIFTALMPVTYSPSFSNFSSVILLNAKENDPFVLLGDRDGGPCNVTQFDYEIIYHLQ